AFGSGFTVAPGKTLTVKVRLSVTSDTVPNRVTANAAVVQRHADDGDWVGQSNDYRFGIDADPSDPQPRPEASAPDGLPFTDELARTGLAPTAATLAAAALLLATGGTLAAARRRR
ncbi:hypothetical protein N4G65_22990, partial [Streptomyces fulvoviolaceus]|nr:hypothetical protein [Streptomyces fulvoviolaceus]